MPFTKSEAASVLGVNFLDTPADFSAEDAPQILGLKRGAYHPTTAIAEVVAYADAAVQALARALGASADGAVLASRTIAASANVAVQTAVQAAAVADAAVSLTRALTTLADAVAAVQSTNTAGANAAVAAVRTLTTGLDLLIQTAGILAALDVGVQTTRIDAASMDGAASVLRTLTLAQDAAVLQNRVAQVSAAAAVQAQALVRTLSLTVAPAARFEIASNADGVAEKRLSVFADIGGAAMVTNQTLNAHADLLVFNFNPFLLPPDGDCRIKSDVRTQGDIRHRRG